MKLLTFEVDGAQHIGILAEPETVLDVHCLCAAFLSRTSPGPSSIEDARGRVGGTMIELLHRGDEAMDLIRRSAEFAVRSDERKELLRPACYRLDEVVLHAPVPRPGKLICIGYNYRSIIRPGDVPNKYPKLWLAASSSVIGHEQPIVRPAQTRELDYEAELAVVIGKRAKHVSREDALSYVAGYTVANDLADKELERREAATATRLLQKSLDTFSPMGPYLVTRDEIPDPQNLNISLRVNGELRQQSNTSEMICGVCEAIEYLSQMTLEPGDVISTGTPGGVPGPHTDPARRYLRPGDVVEAEIGRVGLLRNRVVAE